MSRVLITGGAGFVGSHLTDRLIRDGHEVTVVDNLVTGTATNLEHLRNEPRFRLIESDISVAIPVTDPFDALFHMASPASPKDFVPLAIPILRVGSMGTYNALELASRNRAWFLLASTSEVYGDPLVHPQREDYLGNVNPVGVRGVYDESKRFSEALTMAYFRAGKVKTSIVRIFNTYGPRMRPNDGRVIPNFVSQALRNDPITVYGDGSQTRSLCYVDDLVEGIVRFWRSQPVEPVNLGNDQEISVQALAEAIVKLAGSSSRLIYEPLPEGDPKQRCPNLDRARKVLEWTPRIDRETGLRRTIDYFRTIL